VSIGAIYIVFGASVLAWRQWVLTAQLKAVIKALPQAQRAHYEALLRSPGPKRVFVAVRVCGIAMMVVGVASLLNI
jgi:hypothetical protein